MGRLLPRFAARLFRGLLLVGDPLAPKRIGVGDESSRLVNKSLSGSLQAASSRDSRAAWLSNMPSARMWLTGTPAWKSLRALRVIAPLGVLLPSGLGLKVDQTDIGRAGFVRCLPTGCVAEVVMEDKLLDQMKAATNATFVIFQTPEEGIGIPLALNGFKDGFDKLP